MHKFIYVAAATLFTGSVSLLSAATFTDSVRGPEEELRFEDVFAAASLITDNLRQDDSERESVVSVEEKRDVNDQDLSLVELIGSIPILTPQKVVTDSTSIADRKVLGSGTPPQTLGDALCAAYMKEREKEEKELEALEEAKALRAAVVRRKLRESIGSHLEINEALVNSIVNGHNPIEGVPGVRLQLVYDSGVTATIDGSGNVVNQIPDVQSPVKRGRKGVLSSLSGSDTEDDSSH